MQAKIIKADTLHSVKIFLTITWFTRDFSLHNILMKKLKRYKKSTFHTLPYGRVAVLPEDPTEAVNFVGEEDEDRKYD